MKTLQLSDEKALFLYKDANSDLKTILEESFGKDFFKPKCIMDRVKTFKDALIIKGETISEFKHRTQFDEPHIVAQKKLEIIISVINEDWVAEATDHSQYKYYPWFNLPSVEGSRFSYYDYRFQYTITTVGLRLCTKNGTLCKYVAEQFLDLYEVMLLK